MTQNPTIIITGATRGIGLAVLKRFLQAGFDAAFCGSSSDSVEKVTAALQKEYPLARIAGFAARLEKQDEAISFSKRALEFLGHCTVLVNNAGTFKPGSVLTEEEGVFENLWQVNVSSAYHVSRAVIPSMYGIKRAHVFNMCSIASIVAYPNGGSYCISKFALLGLNKLLREELKSQRICVTAVMPGATLTDSWSGTELPQSRFVMPDNIAEMMFGAWNCNTNACTEELLIRPLEGDI
ncbi:MAG: SDR family NAD(P)-dependent oxidoreductase [Sphingomonadales bacterium]|jgi:NAD(P)-dependent dehydrogenase (short-subunit alcohol dehydrogenase family)